METVSLTTDKKTDKKKGSKEILWHPAFVVALKSTLKATLKATLIDFSDALDYKLEHPLNTEPLRIDVLVIKILYVME